MYVKKAVPTMDVAFAYSDQQAHSCDHFRAVFDDIEESSERVSMPFCDRR